MGEQGFVGVSSRRFFLTMDPCYDANLEKFVVAIRYCGFSSRMTRYAVSNVQRQELPAMKLNHNRPRARASMTGSEHGSRFGDFSIFDPNADRIVICNMLNALTSAAPNLTGLPLHQWR
jgi:hypothetical protein